MHRFFVAPEDIKGNQVLLKEDELRHMVRVLRLRKGDPVVIFDGSGSEYQGKIMAISSEEAVVNLSSRTFLKGESPLDVWLVQGIPKGEKMELIIQKATELGVKGIIL